MEELVFYFRINDQNEEAQDRYNRDLRIEGIKDFLGYRAASP